MYFQASPNVWGIQEAFWAPFDMLRTAVKIFKAPPFIQGEEFKRIKNTPQSVTILFFRHQIGTIVFHQSSYLYRMDYYFKVFFDDVLLLNAIPDINQEIYHTHCTLLVVKSI